ncbi:M48 family metallopeptidase [Pseudomonas sp. AF03-9]|uniref:M48 family metallopeptidase n=1 Tax=Pseudomonas sp. AF03-9 TaxID=2849867 RepID=UPI001CFA190B|nr:M48 family metallopeptidase [Pseudomonas sp. AF03-9]
MNALKLIFLLVIFPLLLAALGGWELQRADRATTAMIDQHISTDLYKQTLQAVAARQPEADVAPPEGMITVQAALARLEKVEAEFPTAHRINRVLRALAPWVIGLGLLATLIGLAALAGTHWAGRRAQQSREQLLRVFSLGSRLLPYVLVSHVVAMAATVALVLVFEGLALWHVGKLGSGVMKLMGMLGMVAALCLYSIWLLLKQLRPMLAMFEPTPLEMFGQRVTPEQAPGLWRHVDELAARLGALPPEHIVASLTQDFYVTSSAALVMPAETLLHGRTLHVPLLYLGLLDREEIGAVIGHELAHFAGEDTEYSLRFLPIYDGVSRSLGALADTILASDPLQGRLMRPSFMLGVFFMERFDHAVNHWRRERELLADAAGARLVGSAAMASALLRVSVLHVALDDTLMDKGANAAERDLPNAVLMALQVMELQLPPEALESQQPHPTDTHPSNGERLQALQVTVDDSVRSATRAVDAGAANTQIDACFSAPQALREALSRDLTAVMVSEELAHMQLLETMVDSVEGERTFHEGGRWRGALMALASTPFVLAGLFAISRPWLAPERLKGTPLSALGAGACLSLIGLALLWLGIRRFKRAPQTALRLTPEHFVFNNLAQLLPIEHIDEVSLQFVQGIWVTVQLTPEAPLPATRKTAFGVPGARVNRKKRQVLLHMAQLCVDNKKIEPYEGLSMMLNYKNAALARRILQQRED